MHYDSSILDALDFFLACQIVPRAIRRIKTCPQERQEFGATSLSESTERQKVH